MKDKVIEIVKTALLKQLHKVMYVQNGYPIEAVSKATILGLEALVGKELDSLSSGGVSKEYPFKCNKCGFEFTSDDLAATYITCTQPFPQRTSGICGGAIELNYPHPTPEISEEEINEVAVKLRYEMQAIEYARQQGGMSESDLKTLWNDLSSLVSEIDKLALSKGAKSISEGRLRKSKH